ncbi:hypothetical protein AA995_05225 [Campylobacter vulpis]|uniref:Permuted papain-like amidase enzyme, YaeF/YiiX, C92 family n=2 Tax=Campylobacter vulpis TaxID=1655500 RepID=A0A2G4R5Y4_9BACT|nr:YiiX/YebB-like N1pC/P60 family cysteine hydrolase [Campylobacter vulpis]PHY90798.1 hypothetical protein AA995_05225 [Campylobacter vulpis]PHY91980.1 hypothetical protein AA994_01675 [Campylobacter vulpis]
MENLKLPKLEIGDLIFRRGNSLESVIISQISGHYYTHLGILIASTPPLIIHATTDDNLNKPNQVILSSLEEFASRAQALAIKRLPLTKAQKEIIALTAKSQLGKKFVLNEGNDTLYCTTFIENLLTPHIKLNLTYEELNLPTLSGKYLFPKAFFNEVQAKLIYEKRF